MPYRPAYPLPLLLLLLLLPFTLLAEGRDFLVDADWLAEEMERNDKLIILEVRYHPHRYHTIGHIPGAIQVQRFADLGDNLGNPIMRFPSREAFQTKLRSWGVNNDSTLVLYDDASTALVARLYYSLELFGFNMAQVKILDGGTIGWSGFNEMTKEPTATPASGNVTLKAANPAMLVEWMDIYSHVVASRNPNVTLIDARPADMYSGKVIRHAIQGGHIPGAINIVSLDGVDGPTMSWKSSEFLRHLYRDVPRDSTIYLYCHDGFRMSLAWLQLQSLGYPDVRLLNGGWSAWDGAMTLPVVEGDDPWGSDYAL
jgi:thiosulfate/3-mercaptopyruvate sulfurtransferase